MTQARRSHEQKTFAERRQYFDTTVRGKLGPTVDEGTVAEDSTENTIPPGIETTRPYRRPTRGRKRKPVTGLFREHWPKALLGIVCSSIIGLLTWALVQVYALNREVGQLRIQTDVTVKDQSDAKTELRRFEDRMAQELDRIDNHLEDRNHR